MAEARSAAEFASVQKAGFEAAGYYSTTDDGTVVVVEDYGTDDENCDGAWCVLHAALLRDVCLLTPRADSVRTGPSSPRPSCSRATWRARGSCTLAACRW